MKVLTALSELGQVRQGSVLTIGNFDGVHVGHREIFRTARRLAQQREAEMVVMTFEPHPVAVLHPEKAPGVLTPLPLKLRLLREYADDCIIVLQDDQELLNLAPEDFVDMFLMASIAPRVIPANRRPSAVTFLHVQTAPPAMPTASNAYTGMITWYQFPSRSIQQKTA